MKEIPILLYQNIGNYPESMMEDGILPETFERQMNFFAEQGYRIVTLRQALDHMNQKLKLPDKSLAITIDGGYQDAFTNVLPVLKRHHFRATFFITPESIGRERNIKGLPIKCLAWNEVREIMQMGMEIGLLAYDGRSIKGEYDEAAVQESVERNMRVMNKHIDSRIRYCAFKEGVPGKSLWSFLENLGIYGVFTQCPTNRTAGNDCVGRIQVDDDDHNIFLTKISKVYLFFKDKRSWKYIRKYKIAKLAHKISELWNLIKGDNG
jgi:peptidoglycan/xylan/chitin deacetylase (PgdA/CDA1 family)